MERLQKNLLVAVLIVLAVAVGSFFIYTEWVGTDSSQGDVAVEIAIITTTDLQSRVVPVETTVTANGESEKITVGGFERISSIAGQTRSDVDGALLVSTGDDLMGPFFVMFNGTPEIEAMNMAGYDVVTPGNHEFDAGVNSYTTAIKTAEFNIVSSNLITENTDLAAAIEPYVIKEVAGVRVGLFGLMTPDLPRVSNVGDEVRVDKDIVAVANENVAALQSEGAELIVALTHIGTELDEELAKEVAGIDVIVGGHSYEYVYETVEGPGGWETVIVQAGAYGEKIGILRFSFNGTVNDPAWETVLLDGSVGTDTEIKTFLDGYMGRYNEQLDEPVGVSSGDLDARKSAVRSGESNLGDLITDSWIDWFRSNGKAVDLALIHGGGIRGDMIYPAGEISYKELLEIHPFGNTVVEVTLSGEELLQVLEISASALRVDGDGCAEENRASTGGFLQISGIRIEIDTAKQPFCAEYEERTVKAVIAEGERVVKAEVFDVDEGEWKTVDPTGEYTVLINSWLAEGGDAHYVFLDVEDKSDTTLTITDLLMYYIQENSPIEPQIDGRIVVK